VVKLRMKRFGRRNRAFFRINAVDIRSARDGRVIEELGFYDPVTKDDTKRFQIDRERVEHWLKQGAQPSETVKGLLVQAGIAL